MSTLSRIAVPPFVAACAWPGKHDAALLLEGGELLRVDLASGTSSRLGQMTVPSIELGDNPEDDFGAPGVTLQLSDTGRYAAASSDFAIGGAKVFDLWAGRETMSIECPTYLPTTVPFSVCFVTHQGREYAIYRSDWNRLDARDAQTGELVTPRGIPNRKSGADAEHDLDYFHRRLTPSPNSRHVPDDGWVWHPVGVPYHFDPARWLSDHPWETEDMAARQYFTLRDDWNFRDCWIDDDRLALRAQDALDANTTPEPFDGIRTIDVSRPDHEQIEIAGARGRLMSDGARLFAASEGKTTVWSVETTEMIAEISDFEAEFIVRDPTALVATSNEQLRVVLV